MYSDVCALLDLASHIVLIYFLDGRLHELRPRLNGIGRRSPS